MIHPIKKVLVHALVSSVMFASLSQTANAAIVTTEQVVSVAADAQNWATVVAAFERADLQAELQKMGITRGTPE